MRRFTLTAALLVSWSWSAVARAADLDVGQGQTYATIQSAAAAAVAGDVVRVHAGEYTEDLDLTQSGSSGSPITIQSAGDGAVTLRGSAKLAGDYWEIADLTVIVQGDVRGFDIDGSHNRLSRLDLSGGANNGVDGSGNGNEIHECKIHGFDAGLEDAHCIVLNQDVSDWVIEGNELYDCSGDGIQLYSDGPTRTIKNTRIEGNTFRYTGAIQRMENAIDVKDADGLVIVGNQMSGFSQNKTMVFQKAPTNIEVRCNVMYDGSTGVEFRGEMGGTVENVTFVHNLMHDFTEYALKFDGTVGATVVSNTFVDAQSDGLRIEGLSLTGGVVRNNLWLRTGGLDTGMLTADHNGFWDVGNNLIASPTDVNEDPLLDAAFHLSANSPMIDRGIETSEPFFGAAPDLGAHEVGLEACQAGSGGAGGAGGAGAGTGGAGGGSGAAGPGSGSNTGSGGSGAGDPEDDSGCSCRAAGRSPASSGNAALLAAMAISAALVRRRRPAGRGLHHDG